MASTPLTPELLTVIAERFKALAEPDRLQNLKGLIRGEMNVTELADETELGQANLSKHLQLLHALGFVTRRKEGLYVYYALANDDVFRLCDIMCGRLGAEATLRRRMLGAR